MKFTAYHGTSKNNSDSILKHNYNFSGKKEWFGSGIYFFEDLKPLCSGQEEAKNWAIYVKKYNKWAVLESEIVTDNVLDLVENINHRKIYDKIRIKAIQEHKNSGLDIKSFTDRVIFLKIAEKNGIDLIRAMVDAGKDFGYKSYVVRRPQIQICVKNVEKVIHTSVVNYGWQKNG